ncbi:monocarboxylate transporter 12-like isoform X2 [Mercenaria mercenaria]|uniref:monocarboxylate transporter 12-like isoform X2 n=1 Tax=Mercenaria mercenaria TaxID=6596 RepID=UPI00234FAF12|nr:monocarboxylate transporter 12-like isoform X2 [Mercenaria mercenaria]
MKLFCNKKTYSDGGYGWVVVLCAFCIGFITDGISFAFGILLVELLDVFEQGRAPTLAIGAVMSGMMYCIGPLSGALCTKYGYRAIAVSGSIISTVGFVIGSFSSNILHLCLSYGFLGGTGFGLMYLSANVCMMHHFKERQAIANGLAMCGSGAGAFAFNHLTNFLLESFGWRGTLLLTGGIVLNGVVFGLLLLQPTTANEDLLSDPNTAGKLNIKEETGQCSKPLRAIKTFCEQTFKEILFKDISCFIFFVSVFLYSFGRDVPFSLIPDQVTELGMSTTQAAWLISVAGITNTVSRAGFGWIGYRQCIKRMVLLEILTFLLGISTGLSFLFISFETKLLYMSMYGIFTGGYNSLRRIVLADIFGMEMLDKSFGLMMLIIAIADAVSTPSLGHYLKQEKDLQFVICHLRLAV